ncbi:ferredoxin [Streptomyces sp. NBC_01618]|uniref:ferredoxin n=1 Tax=Streptomyces sp. NBC_01618 TaxID=2975900 RepID=UPI00386BF2F5|nr:ferredoxin [Streptomyces sp. NBC_01618]
MKVTIDGAKCVGAGNCEADMHDVFEVQNVGPTKVICQPSEDRRRELEFVIGNCPGGAIGIEE